MKLSSGHLCFWNSASHIWRLASQPNKYVGDTWPLLNAWSVISPFYKPKTCIALCNWPRLIVIMDASEPNFAAQRELVELNQIFPKLSY